MSMQLKLAAAIAAFTTRSAAALSTVASPAVASPIVKNVAVPGLKNGMDYVKVGTFWLLLFKRFSISVNVAWKHTSWASLNVWLL